ncbi:MAG: hypothetical protein GC203_13140 [Phenylobacterium sp.]|uniref:hypothetical protein n=1 Tax=Phenylobacterium sp. TaxID=1871053 RepID=UPI0025F1B754|nr:hypothetical protein [Phenylobacterium sp.]MBI1198799.1 hypothetical protein [Phenylobacterium sp.]
MTYSTDDRERTVLEATRARQARRGTHVLWVLVIGTALAALALLAAYAWRASAAPDNGPTPAERQNAAQTFDTPAPPPATPPAGPTD